MTTGSTGYMNLAGPILIGLGLVLLVSSFVWSSIDSGRADWTTEDARSLQQAASRLHELTFSTTPTSPAAEKQAFREAQQEHERLNARRQEAIAASRWRQTTVRWIGVAVTLAGVAITYAHRQNRS